jgi:hypothetical protein
MCVPRESVKGVCVCVFMSKRGVMCVCVCEVCVCVNVRTALKHACFIPFLCVSLCVCFFAYIYFCACVRVCVCV